MNRPLAIATFLANFGYLIWLLFHVTGAWGILFFVAEAALLSLSFLFLINHWSQWHLYHHHNRNPKGSVDIFITVVNEPLHLLEPVVKSAAGINYKNKTVYILDDGPRDEVKAIAKKYGVEYRSRSGARVDAKAGNLNCGLVESNGDYILVLDADQRVTDSMLITEILGYFDDDEDIAAVGTRQAFSVPLGDYNHDTIFYEHIQTGKNDDNAPICVGSGALYRRSALEAIGGFQTWNLVEDLYTSYVFQAKGYRVLYINKAYTIGTAPIDLAGIYHQRGTWATDTLRMFFRDTPLFKRGLSIRQRLHYIEIAYAYLIGGFIIPYLFLLPIFALLLGAQYIDNPGEYLMVRIPSLVLLLGFYYHVCGNSFAGGQFWASLFPVYIKSTVLAFLPGKPQYRVTPKVGSGKRDTWLIIPHLALMSGSLVAVVFYFMQFGFDLALVANVVWISLMIFWITPAIKKGFRKE